MKRMSRLIIELLGIFLASQSAFAGHGVGNGGDLVRATFLEVGTAVVQFLDESDEGQEITSQNRLDLQRLKRVLDINSIEVREGVLVDNGGSVVDAIGSLGQIVLSKERWIEHFEKERDIYFLVFHEMLRAIEVNDDNYVISKLIVPFPQTRKVVTRLARTYPILGSIALNEVIDVTNMIIEGQGCSQKLGDTFSDFDLERNILSISMRRFEIPLIDRLAGQVGCTLLIPYQVPAGKKLSIHQLDFSVKTILSKNAQSTISFDAVFAGGRHEIRTKTYLADQPVQGRLLLRSHFDSTSGCSGTPGLLKIRLAASMQKPSEAQNELNLLISDGVSAAFELEECKAQR